ncbi:hypothetical protein [Paraburkholderia sartisoli]|uniref:hypothetical protein n=1 Tax=Paraburkholderia sartisoli TaxID=83784 RepID=UPI0015A29E5B|nr:hypothetical protein [Paraburkholderia sartisoli]
MPARIRAINAFIDANILIIGYFGHENRRYFNCSALLQSRNIRRRAFAATLSP